MKEMNEKSVCDPGCSPERYGVENIVLLKCSHYRLMMGETDEVVDRVRSDAAEKVVVDVVNKCGSQPDWFFDKWHEGLGLVCAAVFEEAKDAGVFAEEVAKVEGDDVVVLDDDLMRGESAVYFNKKWKEAVEANTQKSRDVIEDAIKNNPDFVGRVLLVDIDHDGELKEIGKEIAAEVGAEVPYAVSKDQYGLLLGFACDDEKQKDEVVKCLNAHGHKIIERMEMDEFTIQMAACLIAKMQIQKRVEEHMAEIEKEKNAGGDR